MKLGLTERLARASAARPWRTVAIWAAALAASLAVVVTLLGSAITSEQEMTNDPESYQAYDLILERLPPEPGTETFGDEIVLVRSETLTVADPEFRRK